MHGANKRDLNAATGTPTGTTESQARHKASYSGRVKSIRASERRIWQQITGIYAECRTDYDKNATTAKDLFAMIQNRFHHAITGQTATEIVYMNTDYPQEHMGLSTWKNAPDGQIPKSDVSIARKLSARKGHTSAGTSRERLLRLHRGPFRGRKHIHNVSILGQHK